MQRFFALTFLVACTTGGTTQVPSTDTDTDSELPPEEVTSGPPEYAHSLRRFESCDDARAYLADVVTEQVYYQSFSRPYPEPNRLGVPARPLGEGGFDLVQRSEGLLWVAAGGDLDAVRLSGDTLSLVASLDLGDFLYGVATWDGLAVVASTVLEPVTGEEGIAGYWFGTRITGVDVSDPAAPEVIWSFDHDGDVLLGRGVGGTMHFVLSDELEVPGIDELQARLWDYNDPNGLYALWWENGYEFTPSFIEEALALIRPEAEALVADLDVDALLPRVRDEGGSFVAASSCESAYRPADPNVLGQISVLQVEAATGAHSTTPIWLGGTEVYADDAHFYWVEPYVNLADRKERTRVHEWSLVGAESRYLRSGEVSGIPFGQGTLDLHEGRVHVATVSRYFDYNHQVSHVHVMEPDDNLFRVPGRLNFAKDSWVYGVRLLGDRAYALDWQGTDVLDLSDPSDPRVRGRLNERADSLLLDVDGTLVVLGYDPYNWLGTRVATYDVTDASKPVLTGEVTATDFQFWEVPQAAADAWATYDGVLAVPVQGQQFDGMALFEVLPGATPVDLGRVDHARLGETVASAPPSIRRAIAHEDGTLYTLSNAGLKLSNLYAPDDEVASILLH